MLNLGIDAIGMVDKILSWERLEMCFGTSFRFFADSKFEITKELALQQGRTQTLLSGKKVTEMYCFQKNAKNLSENIENLIEIYDSRSFAFISNVLTRGTGYGIKAFCDALKALGSKENILEIQTKRSL